MPRPKSDEDPGIIERQRFTRAMWDRLLNEHNAPASEAERWRQAGIDEMRGLLNGQQP